MRARGFTLVELIIVIAIMGILMAIATHNWQAMQLKTGVESQIKTMHADLMAIRLQALYRKQPRSVVISGQQFRVYSSTEITSTPLETKQLGYAVWNNAGTTLTSLIFDAQGLMNGSERTICILPTNDTLVVNDAAVDSLVVSQARINLGKRTGGDCKSGNVEQK
jgi:prepilin-type N-terminal cleavage/methylation domain-containing protein